MKTTIVNFLRAACPFIVALALWRLSAPFWNPGGSLALIPIFFFSFIRPTAGFAAFSVLMCFLIDYKSDTLLFWTALYCVTYAANGFQSVIDMTRWDQNGLRGFLIFWGVGLGILFFLQFDFGNLARMLWLFAWGAVLYTPITTCIKRISHD